MPLKFLAQNEKLEVNMCAVSNKNQEEKLDKYFNALLDQIPPQTINEPDLYQDARDKMNQHVWTHIYKKLKTADPMAFVTKSGGVDGVYEVYVNPCVPDDLAKYFTLHEFGHVIYCHLEMNILQKEIIINKIMSFWPVLMNHFENSEYFTPDSVENIAHSILNIAQDMEVNGKLFSIKEWKEFQKKSQIPYAKALYNANKGNLEEKTNLIKWLSKPEDQRELIFKGIHPSDYHFPVGLSYPQYVDLFIKEHELFFNELINNAISELVFSSDADKANTGKLSSDEINKLISQYNDTNNSANQNLVKKAKDIVDEESAFSGKKGYSPVGSVKLKKSGKGKAQGENIINLNNTKKLEEFILKCCYSKKVLDTHTNTMYYYNRKKYGNELIISKQTSEDLYRPGSIYLLIDCSGSIDNKAINTMVKIIKHLANSMQKKSRLIWWSTELCGDYALRNAEGPSDSGGTFIAGGIEYVRTHYLKNDNDKLIIISDYYDSLTHWYNSLCKIKRNDCMGICWTYGNHGVSVKEYVESAGFNYNDTKIIDDFLYRLPTILVDVA